MPEPILAGVALGVAGNLASNIVTKAGQSLENTAIGRSLSFAGLLKPGFEQKLRHALDIAVINFLDEHQYYKITEVFDFLNSKWLSSELQNIILEQKTLNPARMAERLAHHIGIPITAAPENWPNQIDPFDFSHQLFSSFVKQLGVSADEGLMWISAALSKQDFTLSSIELKIDRVIAEQNNRNVDYSYTIYREFETRYIKHVVSRAQKISTPGARELRGINQSLSVAYISLNLKSGNSAEAVRAEAFLANNGHVTIRGPAGSGKTTLLSWLVTKCDLDNADSDEKWQGYIPFIVPLRKVARLHQGPPSLDRLLEYSVDNKLWVTPSPSGWLEDVVQTRQRAIIMIDGVDELPPSRRQEFWEWVEAFSDEYPQNRMIITSRVLPGTNGQKLYNDQWNPPAQFVDAQLQDMSDTDVSTFVHHWHDSLNHSKLDNEELASLAEARATLPAKLEDAANRRIRELCNTPLLCAMICVLHWREEGYLPRYRVEVYERCCDMLIEARDLKRGVNPPPGPIAAMSKSDKEMVLQQLAIEMMRNRDDSDSAADDNYRVEISKERALEWITTRIQRFQSPVAREASSEAVLDYLVERTGLLREPAKDLIDFPHRTFQEYLAACAAGAESQESMLARQADDDQWHETIMLAAGTSTGGISFGKRLIEKLIRRGENHQSSKERSQRIRKTCFALALGCLENLRQQDEDLRESVLSHLGELVPPRSDDDARILSVAGDAAVSYLSYDVWKDESTTTVSACARALRLIGTTEANRSLERGYALDHRDGVLTEVCRAAAFPLSHMPSVTKHVAENGQLPRYVDIVDLSLIQNLPGLKEIVLDASDTRNLSMIAELGELTNVHMRGVSAASDVLFSIPVNINTLSLNGRNHPTGNWMQRLTNLKKFTIIDAKNTDISRALDHAPYLTNLSILNSSIDNIENLNRLNYLDELELFSIKKLESIQSLAKHPSLKSISIEACRGIHNVDLSDGFDSLYNLVITQPDDEVIMSGKLPGKGQLQQLALQRARFTSLQQFASVETLSTLRLMACSIESLTELPTYQKVREIDLAYVESGSEIVLPPNAERVVLATVPVASNSSLETPLHALQDLQIERCSRINKLNFIHNCPVLHSLSLANLPRLRDIDELSNSSISNLKISNCDAVADFTPISKLKIDHLILESLDNLSDLDFLVECTTLKKLEIAHIDNLFDFSFALNLPNLEFLHLIGLSDDIFIPEPLRPKVYRSLHSRARYYRQVYPWRLDDPWAYADYRRKSRQSTIF